MAPMATTTRLTLVIPEVITLCFLLVVAAAEQETTILLVTGRARCRSNFSRIISNAPMHLVINNATVPGGTGRTTSDGHILIAVNLNSTEQLAALMSNDSKAYLVAPRDACGVPNLPPEKEMAAEVQPMATMLISDDSAGSSSSSVQSLAVAASDTSVRVVNSSLVHADAATTNNGDAAVHLNRRLLHIGDAVDGGPVHVILAKVHCLAVCTLIPGGGGRST